MKKALTLLREEGKIRETQVDGQRVHGVWEWTGATASRLAQSSDVEGEGPEIATGNGRHLVYGMYDKRSKADALANGGDRWPIKVGKTRSRSPFFRIQDAAFLPDRLVWGVAIRTDDPDSDERLLQQLLDRRGLRYEGDGGREWFNSNPTEIVNLYERLIGD